MTYVSRFPFFPRQFFVPLVAELMQIHRTEATRAFRMKRNIVIIDVNCNDEFIEICEYDGYNDFYF